MHAAPHAIRAFACYALAQKYSKLGCIHYRLSMYIHGLLLNICFEPDYDLLFKVDFGIIKTHMVCPIL